MAPADSASLIVSDGWFFTVKHSDALVRLSLLQRPVWLERLWFTYDGKWQFPATTKKARQPADVAARAIQQQLQTLNDLDALGFVEALSNAETGFARLEVSARSLRLSGSRQAPKHAAHTLALFLSRLTEPCAPAERYLAGLKACDPATLVTGLGALERLPEVTRALRAELLELPSGRPPEVALAVAGLLPEDEATLALRVLDNRQASPTLRLRALERVGPSAVPALMKVGAEPNAVGRRALELLALSEEQGALAALCRVAAAKGLEREHAPAVLAALVARADATQLAEPEAVEVAQAVLRHTDGIAAAQVLALQLLGRFGGPQVLPAVTRLTKGLLLEAAVKRAAKAAQDALKQRLQLDVGAVSVTPDALGGELSHTGARRPGN